MINAASTATTLDYAITTRQRLIAVFFGLLVGSLLILGAGFAGPGELHNAAHDSRHAFSFPCH